MTTVVTLPNKTDGAGPLPPTQPSQLQRTAQTLLPFLSLYKPFSQPIAIASGSVQALLSAGQLIESLRKGETQELPMQIANTCISTLSVAGTIFAHPAGMLLTTGRDVVLEVMDLARHVQRGESTEALENCAKLVNNTLFVAMILGGGSPAALAYFGAQALTGLYHSVSEFKKGNYIEGSGHALMSVLRSYQFGSQMHSVLEARAAVKQKEEVRILPAAAATASAATIAAAAINKPSDAVTFEKKPGTFQYKGSDYANAIRVERGISLDKAFEIAKSNPEIDYFCYCTAGCLVLEVPPGVKYDPAKDPLKLAKDVPFIYDSGEFSKGFCRIFYYGDVVFFKEGGMWLGSCGSMGSTYVKAK